MVEHNVLGGTRRMLPESLRWKANRLRAMGAGEVFWRVRQLLQSRFERLVSGVGQGAAVPAPNQGTYGKRWFAQPAAGFDVSDYVQAAERILAGRYDVFSLRDVALGFPPAWNRDPRTGTNAPMTFGKTLNYRSEALVGDIKYLWEPNRHLELVTLAQAFSLTAEWRFAEGARELLQSWFTQCPYPLGPNWTSSLEHAVRIVNWSYAWHLLGGAASIVFDGEAGAQFKRDWLESIYRHLSFIRGHLSRYSSANNHLLGEYMGLFVGSVVWPLWSESGAWRSLAKAGFEHEVLKQNCADGVNREQAIWYHHEVADMMLHCGLVGRANGIVFDAACWGRLESMLDFIASIMDVGGNMPMFGDSDDAVIVRLSQEPGFNVYRSLLATGAVLFGRSDFKAKAAQFDDKSRWLLGDAAASRFDELPVAGVNLPVRREFSDGGYWVLGDRFETDEEVRLVADAGPLGYLSIAAHGHADALSFTLSLYGREIFIDPGTYAYHTQKRWRDYFRGTSAHNTLRIDGQDQSLIGGNFLWLRHAQARCEKHVSTPERDEWEASHDGYQGLPEPVLHRRRISLDKRAKEIRVEDMLEGVGRHLVEIFWHLAEEFVVEADQGEWMVCTGTVTVARLRVPEVLETMSFRGSESPLMGWISRGFDEKQPITTLVSRGLVALPAVFVTRITYAPK